VPPRVAGQTLRGEICGEQLVKDGLGLDEIEIGHAPHHGSERLAGSRPLAEMADQRVRLAGVNDRDGRRERRRRRRWARWRGLTRVRVASGELLVDELAEDPARLLLGHGQRCLRAVLQRGSAPPEAKVDDILSGGDLDQIDLVDFVGSPLPKPQARLIDHPHVAQPIKRACD
jgi:hypothetical protein